MKLLCRLPSLRALVRFQIFCNSVMPISVQSGKILWIRCLFLLPWPALWHFMLLQSSSRDLNPEKSHSSAGCCWRAQSLGEQPPRQPGEEPRLVDRGLHPSHGVGNLCGGPPAPRQSAVGPRMGPDGLQLSRWCHNSVPYPKITQPMQGCALAMVLCSHKYMSVIQQLYTDVLLSPRTSWFHIHGL